MWYFVYANSEMLRSGATRLSWRLFQGSRLILKPARGVKTAVADLRKGDWIEHEGKVLVVHQVSSSHSGRGSRQFAVRKVSPSPPPPS